MEKIFLYRVYKYSKLAFLLVAVFITIYAILFLKKMDMVIFRYNNMFAVPNAYSGNIASTYVLKADDQLIKITFHPYWKKDFLESSLATYAQYLKNNKETYLHQYLQEKFSNSEIRFKLQQKLTADSATIDRFPLWYFQFASQSKPFNKRTIKIAVWQYDYDFTHNVPQPKDSILLQEKLYTIDE